MEPKTTKKPFIKVNGKEFENLEDLPEEIRDLIDKDKNNKIDIIENLQNHPLNKIFKVIPQQEDLATIKRKFPVEKNVPKQFKEKGSGNVIRIVILIALIIGIIGYILYKKAL